MYTSTEFQRYTYPFLSLYVRVCVCDFHITIPSCSKHITLCCMFMAVHKVPVCSASNGTVEVLIDLMPTLTSSSNLANSWKTKFRMVHVIVFQRKRAAEKSYITTNSLDT